ncbi:hypothetical protein HOU02_gp107 [Caulobacter phage CcrBL9]|uniref:Uncharacterized protein n=1 Tax=Caulobacter phage CcrBL9 TaxID=2283270 RepID=A0A385EB56_9CAUD|nr:hypothetical protein HOU02_gp107 [Caulobacter phage CcrBL9]AXQ69131.1 hypothetical protein CcrBL9_gp107 [Caulobacter phage CcrBL9]
MIQVTEPNRRVTYLNPDHIVAVGRYDATEDDTAIIIRDWDGYLRVVENVIDVTRLIRASRKYGDHYDYVFIDKGVLKGERDERTCVL